MLETFAAFAAVPKVFTVAVFDAAMVALPVEAIVPIFGILPELSILVLPPIPSVPAATPILPGYGETSRSAH